MCISLFGGLVLGGLVRFVQHRIETSRQTNNVKGLMFGYGDVDTFHSKGGRKKTKKKEEKEKEKETKR